MTLNKVDPIASVPISFVFVVDTLKPDRIKTETFCIDAMKANKNTLSVCFSMHTCTLYNLMQSNITILPYNLLL